KLPAPVRDDPRIDFAEAEACRRLNDFGCMLEAGRRAERKGGALVVAQATGYQALALVEQGEFAGSLALREQARRTFHQAGNLHGEASALTTMGVALAEHGDLTGARERFEESVALARSGGWLEGIFTATSDLAILERRRGNLVTVLRYDDEALSIAR